LLASQGRQTGCALVDHRGEKCRLFRQRWYDKLASYDQRIVRENYGTMAADALYQFDLYGHPRSNGGALDQAGLLAIQPQTTVRTRQGTFPGFSVSGRRRLARNTHAGVLRRPLRLMTARFNQARADGDIHSDAPWQ